MFFNKKQPLTKTVFAEAFTPSQLMGISTDALYSDLNKRHTEALIALDDIEGEIARLKVEALSTRRALAALAEGMAVIMGKPEQFAETPMLDVSLSGDIDAVLDEVRASLADEMRSARHD